MYTLSIKFFLKNAKNSISKQTIYTRIVFNRTKAEISVGCKIFPGEWNEAKERAKENHFINEQLTKMERKIYEAKNELDKRGSYYNATDIKRLVKGERAINTRLIDHCHSFVERKKRQARCTPTTIQKYIQTTKYLESFLNGSKQANIYVANIDKRFIKEFDDFLKEITWNEIGQKLTLVTINKHHSRLKAILFDAISRGLLKKNPYREFPLSFPHKKRDFLTEDEIDRLSKLDLKSNPSLEKTRDIFLFSCYTGLRYSDGQNLTYENLIPDGSDYQLQFQQQKTSEKIQIPLVPQAQKIIEKYSLDPARIKLGKLLPQLSNQKVNQYLKVLAEMAGINKRLSHHIARHTCATTILLNNGVGIEVVQHWLGHTKLSTTQVYAKITQKQLQNAAKKIAS